MIPVKHISSVLLALYLVLVVAPYSNAENDSSSLYIWLSDYTLENSRYHSDPEGPQHIRPEEYNGFRYSTEYDSEFISKSGNSAYTISTQVKAAVFSCQSAINGSLLPVLWKKPTESGPSIFSLTSDFEVFPIRASIFTADMKDHPENKVFRSDLSFKIEPGYGVEKNFNFTVTCFSATDPKINSTLHVNLKGEETDAIRHTGYLEHQTTEKSTNVDDTTGGDSSNKNETQNWEEFTPRLVLKGKASIGLTSSNLSHYSSYGYLTCCTGAPNGNVDTDARECDEEGFGCSKKKMAGWFRRFKRTHRRSSDSVTRTTKTEEPTTENTTEKNAEANSGIVAAGGNTCTSQTFQIAPSIFILCNGDNMDIAQEYVVTFKGAIEQDEELKWSRYNFTPTSELDKLRPEHKIFMALGKGRWAKGDKEERYSYSERQRVKAKASIYSSVLQNGRSKANPFVEEISPDLELADGEPVQVMCVFLRHFYADGGRLRLNWKNGTKTVLKVDHDPSLDVRFQKGRFSAEDWRPLFRRVVGRIISAHPEMESVECFVPHLKGVGWDSRILLMNLVKAVIPPTFIGPAVEVVEMGLNETLVGFSCEVHQFPVNDISIFRNDGDDSSIENWAAVTIKTDKRRASAPDYILKTTVTFDFVTEEVFGEYTCFTENFRGQSASKTVKVVAKRLN